MSLKKTFAAVTGGLFLSAALVTGAAAGINGVEHGNVTGTDSQGHPTSLQTTTLRPVFEKQSFKVDGHEYWCFATVSLKCPIPVRAEHQPAYSDLKRQLKK